MKRTPLNRGNKELKRTPLKSGGGGLKRAPLKSNGKPLKSKTPLKPRSEKTAKKYREERIPLVKRLLEERPWCEACKAYAEVDGKTWFRPRPSRDLHEIRSRGRTGGVNSTEWLDPDNILCVCREDHNRITDDPETAEILGLLAPSGCGNMNTHKMIREAWSAGNVDKAVEIWRTYPGCARKALPQQIERLCSPQVDSSSENSG